ncbi:phosphate transporter (Pho88) [Binucleata daphniae]
MEVTLQAIDQGTNIAFTFILMQILKKIDQTNADFLFYLRICYAVTQIFNIFMLYTIKERIEQRNDIRKFKQKKVKGFFDAQQEEAEDEDEEVEQTNKEYDFNEYTKNMRSFVLQAIIISLCHYKWKISQPLMVQSVGVIKNLFLNPLYLCYLRNKEIKRPYEKNMLFEKVQEEKEKTE